MTTRSPALAGLMALALSIYGLALGGPGAPSQAQEAQVIPDARAQSLTAQAPFACSLMARSEGGGTALEGRLQAQEAISASYSLKVRGTGVTIDQGGDLTLAAGESTILGEAQVSGGLGTLDVELTVTANGRTYACPIQES